MTSICAKRSWQFPRGFAVNFRGGFSAQNSSMSRPGTWNYFCTEIPPLGRSYPQRQWRDSHHHICQLHIQQGNNLQRESHENTTSILADKRIAFAPLCPAPGHGTILHGNSPRKFTAKRSLKPQNRERVAQILVIAGCKCKAQCIV